MAGTLLGRWRAPTGDDSGRHPPATPTRVHPYRMLQFTLKPRNHPYRPDSRRHAKDRRRAHAAGAKDRRRAHAAGAKDRRRAHAAGAKDRRRALAAGAKDSRRAHAAGREGDQTTAGLSFTRDLCGAPSRCGVGRRIAARAHATAAGPSHQRVRVHLSTEIWAASPLRKRPHSESEARSTCEHREPEKSWVRIEL